MFTSDNILAMYLGIDGFKRRASTKTDKTHYIFLNRGAICISESEKDRIMNLQAEKE